MNYFKTFSIHHNPPKFFFFKNLGRSEFYHIGNCGLEGTIVCFHKFPFLFYHIGNCGLEGTRLPLKSLFLAFYHIGNCGLEGT